MTRAKKTLTLCRMNGTKTPFLQALTSHPSVLQRPPAISTPEMPPGILNRFQRTSLRDVNLSYPGRLQPDHPIHADISALQPGDPLRVHLNNDRYTLIGPKGRPVGRTSSTFQPLDAQIPHARVLAIARWHKYKSDPQYRNRYRCDSWDLVIPEFIYPA